MRGGQPASGSGPAPGPGRAPGPGPPPVLAAERTALAWGRTALGLVGVAALLLRFARRDAAPLGEAVAAFALLVAVLVWWHGRRAYRSAPLAPPATALRALALGVAAVAAGAATAVAIGLA